MANTSDSIIRKLFAPSLQGGAARMVLGLGAFSALGAAVAWLLLP